MYNNCLCRKWQPSRGVGASSHLPTYPRDRDRHHGDAQVEECGVENGEREQGRRMLQGRGGHSRLGIFRIVRGISWMEERVSERVQSENILGLQLLGTERSLWDWSLGFRTRTCTFRVAAPTRCVLLRSKVGRGAGPREATWRTTEGDRGVSSVLVHAENQLPGGPDL